jgi:hypothetical protein
VAARILSLGSTEFVRRRVDTATHGGAARALFATNAALIVATVGLGLAGNFGLAVAAYLLATVCRTTSYPVYTAWINQQAAPQVRATVLSMTAQSDAGGPVLGAVGTAVSLRAAITAAGFVLLPVLPLLTRTIRRPVGAAVPLVAVDE